MATNLPPFSFMLGYHRYFREDIFERFVLFEKYIEYSMFVSPGIYTIETDFSFVPAPTLGIDDTLGIKNLVMF